MGYVTFWYYSVYIFFSELFFRKTMVLDYGQFTLLYYFNLSEMIVFVSLTNENTFGEGSTVLIHWPNTKCHKC